MAVRFVHAEPGRVGASVVARVAALVQSRSVLVVSARLAAPVLRRELEAGAVDLSRVFILDVTSHGLHGDRDPEHEAYVSGPAMLELIAKRAQQIVRAKAERPVTIVVDDVATFALYNPREALVEILRQGMAMRAAQNEHEYVLSGDEPQRLLETLRAVVAEECDILPSGELAGRRFPPPAKAPPGAIDLSKRFKPER